MAKDEAIRNQKVFVRLENVLKLQRWYAQLIAAARSNDSQHVTHEARREAVENVIAMLELPIR